MAADTKRQNAGGRVPVALPKGEPPSQSSSTLVSLEAGLQQAIGSRIRVSTVAPQQTTVEGTLYTADPLTNLLVLNISMPAPTAIAANSLFAPNGNYRIIPLSQIANYQILSLPTASTDSIASPAHNSIDVHAAQARLAKNIAGEQAAQARLGPKGTSPTDQALFDALDRTHKARWQGNFMIIADTFSVEKPYGAPNVRFVEGGHGDLDRMKRVVDLERQKITLRLSKGVIDGKMVADGSAAKGSPGGVKKGG